MYELILLFWIASILVLEESKTLKNFKLLDRLFFYLIAPVISISVILKTIDEIGKYYENKNKGTHDDKEK